MWCDGSNPASSTLLRKILVMNRRTGISKNDHTIVGGVIRIRWQHLPDNICIGIGGKNTYIKLYCTLIFTCCNWKHPPACCIFAVRRFSICIWPFCGFSCFSSFLLVWTLPFLPCHLSLQHVPAACSEHLLVLQPWTLQNILSHIYLFRFILEWM